MWDLRLFLCWDHPFLNLSCLRTFWVSNIPRYFYFTFSGGTTYVVCLKNVLLYLLVLSIRLSWRVAYVWHESSMLYRLVGFYIRTPVVRSDLLFYSILFIWCSVCLSFCDYSSRQDLRCESFLLCCFCHVSVYHSKRFMLLLKRYLVHVIAHVALSWLQYGVQR